MRSNDDNMWTTTDYYTIITAISTIIYNTIPRYIYTYHTTQRQYRYRSFRCSVLQMNIHFLKQKSFGSAKKTITKPCAFPFTVFYFFVVFVVYIFIYNIPIQQHSNGLTGFPECDPLLMVRTSFFTIIIGRMCSNRCSRR